jgi:hypothetical protein
MPSHPNQPIDDLPIVCALSAAERANLDGRLPGLLRRAPRRVELSNGYRFEFDGNDSGLLAQLATAIEAERRCCRFFRFRLAIDADLGPITLDLSGPGDAKAFLANLLG